MSSVQKIIIYTKTYVTTDNNQICVDQKESKVAELSTTVR